MPRGGNLCKAASIEPDGAVAKNPPAMREMQEMRAGSLGGEDTLEEGTATHSRFLPRESHGQRGLVGYSPWVHKKSRTRLKQLSTHIHDESAAGHEFPVTEATTGVRWDVFKQEQTETKGF